MKTDLEAVLKVIHKWQEDNDVIFHGVFVSFDEDVDVKEGKMICYGDKETLEISLEEFNKEFRKDKGKFINW